MAPAVRWARASGVPYVLTANGTLLRHERKIGIKWAWDRLVSGHIPTDAKKLVAVSASDVARHRQAGIEPDKIVRIPNGLDLGEFSKLPDRGVFREKYGNSGE